MPRSKNKYADALATLVLKLGTIKECVIHIPLEVKTEPVATTGQERSSWIQKIKQKLEDPKLKNLKEIKAFMLLNGQLYKKLGDGVLVRCISESLGMKILEKVHDKVCGLEGPTLAMRLER